MLLAARNGVRSFGASVDPMRMLNSAALPFPSAMLPPLATVRSGKHLHRGMSLQEQELAWQQVLARDAAADGAFVYAVSTTGVYCRPVCPSRRPARANVQFFRRPSEAEAAGFRACLRCQAARASGVPEPLLEQVRQAAALLRGSGTQRSLEDLARETGASKFTLLRGFRRVLGLTPKEFGRAERRQRLTRALESGESVTAALYAAGFGSSSRLYEKAKELPGMLPSTLQRGGAGAAIRYAVADSPLDRMLVAITEKGVCAVAFGAVDSQLADDLRVRFPKAQITRDDGALADTVQGVLKVLGGEPLAARGLALDIRRTAFQERVWKAMQAIPRGETLTYSELAERVGSPRAVRAVGKACGDNPVAVLIPCHRVVAQGGKLHNYRWGVERKKKLLAMESSGKSKGTSPELRDVLA